MFVELPYRFTRESMYQLLEEVIDKKITPKDTHIMFNFESLKGFIEPAGVTILSNLIEWLLRKNVNVGIWYPEQHNAEFSSDPIKYLDDSRFFLKHSGKYVTLNPKTRATTIPLQYVAYNSSIQWLETTFITWLSRQLDVPVKSLSNVKMCFGEIFNNIKDHAFAKGNLGCIFAQHYPNKKTINIAISDFGVGIPMNIRKIHPDLNDGEALEYAIKEGFTTKTSPRNLGAGLHTLYRNIVEDNGGTLHIHSGYGILNSTYVNNGPKISHFTKSGYYPGTLIEIILRTDNISNIISYDEEEFDWD